MSNIVLFDAGHRFQTQRSKPEMAWSPTGWIKSAWMRIAGLQNLRALSDRLLRDVGLDRAEIDQGENDTEIILRAARREWSRWAP